MQVSLRGFNIVVKGDVVMKITITGRKCSPREPFRARAEKKLAKIERLFGEDAEAKITVTVEKASQVVEITVIKAGMFFRAEERAENMEDALDACVDSLIRQIRKNKTKLEKRLHAEKLEWSFNDEAVAEETAFELVREKEISLRPQDVEEAILQMNMLSHRFYVFLNAETGEINVVYKRNDGGYGIIIPQVK